jgi:hypothetical protein
MFARGSATEIFAATRMLSRKIVTGSEQISLGCASSSFHNASRGKGCFPKPSRVVAFRKRAGMIWSVSTFSSGSGTNLSFIMVGLCMSTHEFTDICYYSGNSRGCGCQREASRVRAPAPCLPSKFRLLVEMQYSPAGILSSFIPRQALQPAWRNSKPASSKCGLQPFGLCLRAYLL